MRYNVYVYILMYIMYDTRIYIYIYIYNEYDQDYYI